VIARDYEAAARLRDQEDVRRGYSIGGGGWVHSADGQSIVPPSFVEPPTTSAINSRDDDTVVMGYALLWNKIVKHDGQHILVRPNAFTDLQSGSEIFFQHNHDKEIRVASNKNNLVLYADEIGLAFKLFVPNTALGKYTRYLVRSNGKSAMSASFVGTNIEKRVVDDIEVQIVTKGELFEISLVTTGACGPAFAALVHRNSCGTLLQHCDDKRMKSDLHFAAMMRACRKLISLSS
jgi:HK97 family phage prohead protease